MGWPVYLASPYPKCARHKHFPTLLVVAWVRGGAAAGTALPAAISKEVRVFPEGNVALATDDEARSLKKWNSLLVEAHGAIGTVPYPEGTTPLYSDSEERSKRKINAIYKALE